MRFVTVFDLIPETDATPEQIAFASASHRLNGMGRTLATMVAASREPLDPMVAQALTMHIAAVEAYETAYAELMDPTPGGLVERCIAAVHEQEKHA